MYKRRNYFIDKAYQGRMVLRIIMICAAGLLFELVLFNFLSYRNLEQMRWRTHIGAETVGDITNTYLLYSSILGVTFTCVALFAYLRVMNRRTAGPLYRMKRDIEMAADGDLSLNIWLRREDDFKETANELNLMVAAIRQDFKQLGDGLANVGRTIDVLEYVEDRPEFMKQKCRQLIEHLEPLKNIRQ